MTKERGRGEREKERETERETEREQGRELSEITAKQIQRDFGP